MIEEIDQDPNSPGYKKALHEYMFAGDKVVGLTSYKYLGDQEQIIKVALTYKLLLGDSESFRRVVTQSY